MFINPYNLGCLSCLPVCWEKLSPEAADTLVSWDERAGYLPKRLAKKAVMRVHMELFSLSAARAASLWATSLSMIDWGMFIK